MVDPCIVPDLPTSIEFTALAAARKPKSWAAAEDRPAAADVFWHGSPAMVFGSSSCCSSSGDSAKFLCWCLFIRSTFFAESFQHPFFHHTWPVTPCTRSIFVPPFQLVVLLVRYLLFSEVFFRPQVLDAVVDGCSSPRQWPCAWSSRYLPPRGVLFLWAWQAICWGPPPDRFERFERRSWGGVPLFPDCALGEHDGDVDPTCLGLEIPLVDPLPRLRIPLYLFPSFSRWCSGPGVSFFFKNSVADPASNLSRTGSASMRWTSAEIWISLSTATPHSSFLDLVRLPILVGHACHFFHVCHALACAAKTSQFSCQGLACCRGHLLPVGVLQDAQSPSWILPLNCALVDLVPDLHLEIWLPSFVNVPGWHFWRWAPPSLDFQPLLQVPPPSLDRLARNFWNVKFLNYKLMNRHRAPPCWFISRLLFNLEILVRIRQFLS